MKTHICSLCTSADNIFPMVVLLLKHIFPVVVLLSIKIVFCNSPTIVFPKDRLDFTYHFLYAFTKCTDYEWYYNDLLPNSSFLKFKCELCVFHLFSFLFTSMLFSCGHPYVANPHGFFLLVFKY